MHSIVLLAKTPPRTLTLLRRRCLPLRVGMQRQSPKVRPRLSLTTCAICHDNVVGFVRLHSIFVLAVYRKYELCKLLFGWHGRYLFVLETSVQMALGLDFVNGGHDQVLTRDVGLWDVQYPLTGSYRIR